MDNLLLSRFALIPLWLVLVFSVAGCGDSGGGLARAASAQLAGSEALAAPATSPDDFSP